MIGAVSSSIRSTASANCCPGASLNAWQLLRNLLILLPDVTARNRRHRNDIDTLAPACLTHAKKYATALARCLHSSARRPSYVILSSPPMIAVGRGAGDG